MAANQTGTNNTAVGTLALDANTTGINNSVLGYDALGGNVSGGFNVAIGVNALLVNNNSNNVAVGANALEDATGSDNVAVGRDAGKEIIGGSGNTCVGFNAGDNTTTGGNNTSIGNSAEPSAADASNEVTLGNSSVSALRCQVALTVLSDKRDKTNIVDLPTGLDFINLLKPRKFEWKTREGVKTKDGTVRAGFIAQELQEAQKGSEYLNLVYESNPEKLEATYGNLIPVLVKAVQELSTKVTALEAG